jgi:hypothetical protein
MGTLTPSAFTLRIEVLWHQDELDRALAAGTAPDSSPQHQLRALQLQSEHKRRELAHAVDSILHRAQHPPHWHSVALPVHAEVVQDAQPELEALRRALLRPGELSPQGLALVSLLLHGPDSPIRSSAPPGNAAAQARAALTALTTD